MNIQERIEALEAEFNERLKALKAEVQREDEFPQFGDDYWYVDSDAEVMDTASYDGEYDQDRLSIGNVFKTKEQAQFVVEKLKVEAELRKYSRPFKEGENENWFILWGTYKKEVQIDWSRKLVRQGTIYFESRKKANEAVESVGEERIKKYIFGVEDQL